MSVLTNRLKHELSVMKAEGFPSMYVKLEDMEALLGEAKAVGAVPDKQYSKLLEIIAGAISMGWIALSEADSLRAALASSPALPLQGWMPIETAPKDGTRFIGCYEGRVDFWHWQDLAREGTPIGWRDTFITVCRAGEGPTHWQPLPPPATVEQKEKQNG
jgi:hypothetical protein